MTETTKCISGYHISFDDLEKIEHMDWERNELRENCAGLQLECMAIKNGYIRIVCNRLCNAEDKRFCSIHKVHGPKQTVGNT